MVAPTTTRRGALAASVAAALFGAPAMAAPNPDAELLALCKEVMDYDAMCRREEPRIYALPDKARDAEWEAIYDQQPATVEDILEIEAATVPGLRAQARAVMALLRDPSSQEWPAYQLAESITRLLPA